MKNQFGHKKITGLFSIVMALLIVFTSLFHSGSMPVYAEELRNNVITGASLTDTNGNQIPKPIGAWRPFRINVNYNLPNNTVHAGDTTTMTLPVGFSPAQPFQFEVKAGNDVVANGKIVDGNPAKVVLTYTAYVDTHSGIQGSFYFNAQINSNTQTQTGDIPVTLTISGDQAIVNAGMVTFNPPKVEPVPLIKAGWQDSKDKTIGHYKINVNQTNQTMVGAVLSDTLLNPGVEYVEGSFQVLEGVWVKNPTGTDIQFTQERDITAEFANKISVQGNHFTIAIGSRPAGKGLQIRYKVKINYEAVAGEVFKNEVELDNNGQNHKYVASYKINDASGSGQGYNFTIEINKTDPNGRPLQNAVFDVIRKRSGLVVGQIASDANGYAKLGGLLSDDYILREVTPPAGYSPAEDIDVHATEFNAATKTVKKTIVNQPAKTSIPVTKVWIGKEADSVTVNLYADGVKIDSKQLTAANQWQYTFTNLDKYNNGNEIQYTVKEETLANYDSAITGDMANGFKITNTNTEKVTIPVEKKWVGPAAASATVKLLADGVVKETVTLNAAGNWKHTFNNLPKYDATDGHEIVYTIDEENVTGYSTKITGDAKTGFTITNTKNTPKTYDNTNIGMFMILMVASLVILGVDIVIKKRYSSI